ncbi:MAG: efflux RND transporter periplasmic adaptor subunit [Thermodesulfobacteriota bacterium]|nr:efflux RND transporter periplasmic adaptor subunit [Thermodesulfobacteriota bacterium]
MSQTAGFAVGHSFSDRLLAWSHPLRKGSISQIVMLWMIFFLTTLSPTTAIAAPAKKASPPPLVTVVTVTEGDVNPLTEYVGHVEAVQSVDLQARISGVLEQVHFKEGSNVRAGDLLYVIEPAPYQVKVAANQARVTKSQVILKKANQHLQRIRTVRSGGIPITDIEVAEAVKEQALAELQEAQAVLRLSEIELGYTRISAPISGRIGATALTKGNLCGPTSGALARIVQLNPIRIKFSLSENDISAIKAAQTDATNKQTNGIMNPQLKLADGTLLNNFGQIDFVDNRVDPTTGTIAVRALFANSDAILLPGQYVTLVAGRRQARLLPVIPQTALLEDRNGQYVWVVNGENQVNKRPVTTGTTIGSSWIIETGLTAGETVIIQGVQKVRPGQTVKTTTADHTKKD